MTTIWCPTCRRNTDARIVAIATDQQDRQVDVYRCTRGHLSQRLSSN